MSYWVLILFAHVGMFGDGNSNSITTAQFLGKDTCVAAGQAAKALSSGSTKEISFVCVKG